MKKYSLLALTLKSLCAGRRRCWGQLHVLATAMLLCGTAKGALVLDEQFSYSDGNLNGQGGWTVTGGATTAIVGAGNLDFLGLDSSSGKQIQMDGAGGTFVKANGSSAL